MRLGTNTTEDMATQKPADLRFYHAPRPVNPLDAETREIENNPDLYTRVLTRIECPPRLIPAEEVLRVIHDDDGP